MEIAVFGGTFDPPTVAHDAIIQACVAREDIDQVWLMPSGVRSDKPGMRSDDTRLAMLALVALQYSQPRLTVSDFELNLPRPSKSSTTVRALEAAYPNNRFWFVFGADSYETMHTWEDGLTLKNSIGMLLVERAGYQLPAENTHIRHLVVKNAKANISSTLIRELSAEGKSVDGLISPQIKQFIVKHGLYEQVTID